jgi:hypothetical protein
VPHCATCDRFYNPNSLKTDGTCPTCGAQLGEPLKRVEHEGAPWHFKLLIAITVVYLGWRFVQLATALLT